MEDNKKIYRTYTLTFLMMVVSGYICFGQTINDRNLLPDGSFETLSKNNKYPSNPSFILNRMLRFWYSPNNNSPDYFHKKATKLTFSVPHNVQGNIIPKSGDAYIGLCTYLRYRKGYSEYVTSKLTEPLKPGALYCISLYASLSTSSEIASNSLGVLFSKDKYQIEDFPKFKEQIGIRSYKMIDSVGTWQNIILEYKATGEENYITVGNFSPKKTIKNIYNLKHPSSSAYFYIDDVAVYEKKTDEPCHCISVWPTVMDSIVKSGIDSKESIINEEKKDTIKNQTLTFGFVTFESNRSELLPESKRELDSLAGFLEEEQNINIDIIGHTDNEGNKLKNAFLSVQRAQAVKEYLRKKGINPERMRTRGRGDSEPISDNKTKQGRSLNRRVEVKLYWLAK